MIIYNFCLIQFVHYAQYNFVVPVGEIDYIVFGVAEL